MTAYQLARLVSLCVAGTALGSIGLFTGLGTLFFDDPHASYADFLAFMGRAALWVAVVAVVCLLGARLLHRGGRARAATVLAWGPSLFVVLGAVWVFLPFR